MSDVKRIKKVKDIIGKNKLKIAFIADDIKTLKTFGVHHNATFGLMLASQKVLNQSDTKGALLLARADNLTIREGKVYGNFEEVVIQRKVGKHLQVVEKKEYDLSKLDLVFIRQDPPVDQNYFALAQTLALVANKTFVLNDPDGVLKANEKLCALNFPDLMPPTIVSSNKKDILNFLEENKEVVIKPLFYKGGIGVERLKLKDKKVPKLLSSALRKYKTLMVQKYLSGIKHGDKRIILLNGEIIGAILRTPKKGEFRAHLSRGASYKKLKLSKRDRYVCKRLKPYLKRNGLYFAGVDLIGDYLIEVNITCPANVVEASECHREDLALKIIKWALKKRHSSR